MYLFYCASKKKEEKADEHRNLLEYEQNSAYNVTRILARKKQAEVSYKHPTWTFLVGCLILFPSK